MRLKILFLLAVFVSSPVLCAAVEIQGRSSTQFLWYSDIVDASSRRDVAEYLRISIAGIDSREKLSIQAYARAVYDVKDGGEVKDRLYYFYADYKDFMNSADLRLGRQFVNLSAGSGLIDGVQADIKNLGPFGFIVMGGRDILFSEDDELTSHAFAGGASLYLSGFKKTDLDVSYYRAYDFSDISRDIIGGSFKQYLLDSVKIYANGRYDLTAEIINEALGGIKYFPTLDLMLTAEYYQSYPTFDTTSIYSVFAVNKYKEKLARAEYTAASWLDLSAGYSKEDFGDENGDADLYQVGLKIRPSIRTTIGMFHDVRDGYGGDLDGYKFYAEYSTFGKWRAAAGADIDSYQRDDMTGEETAKRYWASGRYFFAKNMSGSIRVEDNVNLNYSKDMKGRVTFDLDF